MEKDYSYSSQVNRRMASTHFLISSYEQLQDQSLAPLEKQAFLDSILLQLYCSCVSYCNELLGHCNDPTVAPRISSMNAVFEHKNYAGMSEFTELYWLFQKKKCGLFELCNFYETLTNIGSEEEQESNRKQRERQDEIDEAASNLPDQRINLVTIDVITVDSQDIDSEMTDLTDITVIKDLLLTLQELIDRQREYWLEY